jgi:uncharacterized protein YndB with AHSA1/START domain
MTRPRREKTRSIETSIDIPADAEVVWKALTDAEELTRWFPLEARVKPGMGGHIWMSWRGEWSEKARIDVWRPNEQLRLIVEGPPSKKGGPVQLVIDHHLEAKSGGGTILRLVHSGFGSGENWDHLYDGTKRGWRFELRGLRHYLMHHHGSPRQVIHVSRRFAHESLDAIWQRLMSAEGLLKAGEIVGLGEGECYDILTSTDDRLCGTVHINSPPLDFCATVENLNMGLLRVRVDGPYGTKPGNEMNLWLSSYGLSDGQIRQLKESWQRIGDGVAGRGVEIVDSSD